MKIRLKKKKDKNDNEEEKKKLLLKLNIEKLSRMQSHQLNFISALSTRNKRRWICTKEKIIREIRKEKEKKRDQKLMLMRMSFLNDMSDFIANEVEDLIKEHGDKRKKKTTRINKPLKENIDMQIMDTIIDKDILKTNLESNDKDQNEDDLKVKKEKGKLTKGDVEKKAFSLKSKDALGKLDYAKERTTNNICSKKFCKFVILLY